MLALTHDPSSPGAAPPHPIVARLPGGRTVDRSGAALMTGIAERTTSGSDIVAEVKDWLAADWDPDLPVAEWWERLGTSGWAVPTWQIGRASWRERGEIS